MMNPLSIFLPRAWRAGALAALLLVAAGCAHIEPPSTAALQSATPKTVRDYDDTWFAAARLGRIDILRALADAGYPLDARTREGYTALILSAYRGKGDAAIARTLIATRCPIDQTNNAGATALSFATLFGRLDLLPTLVARGADPDHVDALGRTALQTALLQGNRDAAAALERLGATPNADQTLRMRP